MDLFPAVKTSKKLETKMEETYPVESYPYVSQPLKCHDYFVEFRNVLSQTLYNQETELETKNTTLEKIACLMEISLDECIDLDKKCRWDY